MATQPPSRRLDRRWMVTIGAVLLALGIGAAVLLNRPGPVAQAPPSGQPSLGQASANPSDVASPSPSVEPPSPSASPTVSQSPYCRAFGTIRTAGVSTGGDDGGVDFDRLSQRFAELITRYTAAAKLAPASLRTEYTEVIAYLKQAKGAVDSRDLERVKTMVKNLATLNATMTRIQAESEGLCG